MTMTRRTTPRKPKKEPVVVEPETTLCVAPEPALADASLSPSLGMCVGCDFFAAHSLVDKLCYNCHKAAEGLVYDEDRKLFVKGKR